MTEAARLRVILLSVLYHWFLRADNIGFLNVFH